MYSVTFCSHFYSYVFFPSSMVIFYSYVSLPEAIVLNVFFFLISFNCATNGDPQNGRFVVEYRIKMDDLGVPLF